MDHFLRRHLAVKTFSCQSLSRPFVLFCFPKHSTQRVRETQRKSQYSRRLVCRLLLLHSFVVESSSFLPHTLTCVSFASRERKRYEEKKSMRRRKVKGKYCVFHTTDKKSPSPPTSLSSCETRHNQDSRRTSRTSRHKFVVTVVSQLLVVPFNTVSLHSHHLSSSFILSS